MTWRRLLSLCLFVLALASGACSPRVDSGPAGNEIALKALPAEGQATYALIRRGGPFPYSKDGTTFFNREGLLPARPRGHYKEYTVPTPGSRDRGARRIVVGGDPKASGDFWYTDDHYRSFRRIRE
jgi:ribonuclease T1